MKKIIIFVCIGLMQSYIKCIDVVITEHEVARALQCLQTRVSVPNSNYTQLRYRGILADSEMWVMAANADGMAEIMNMNYDDYYKKDIRTKMNTLTPSGFINPAQAATAADLASILRTVCKECNDRNTTIRYCTYGLAAVMHKAGNKSTSSSTRSSVSARSSLSTRSSATRCTDNSHHSSHVKGALN